MLVATRQLVGGDAIVVIDELQPDKVVVAREGLPRLLGLVEDGLHAGYYAPEFDFFA